MKEKTINYILLGLLMGTFFFNIIPIPTENQQGVCVQPTDNYNPDAFCQPQKWIYGGIYFTSISEQMRFENYPFLVPFLSLFVLGFGTNKLWAKL